jgi:D-inositol-3-phosphate glycosyltransferase
VIHDGFELRPGVTKCCVASHPDCTESLPPESQQIEVSLLTGGFDRPYVFGLVTALAIKNISLDIIGNSIVETPEMHSAPKLTFRSFYWEPRKNTDVADKIWQVLRFYARIILYAARTKSKIFHILWNNKFQFFDRTLLMLYYKAVGKKLVFTAHNVNAGKRDSNDSLLNRLTLKIQYRLADHIFVHTEKMKRELLDDFGVRERAVTVIPFGINNSVPDTDITRAQARRQLGIGESERTILFFGGVRPYKGLQYLVDAFNQLGPGNYRLIIAGEVKKGTEQYMSDIQEAVSRAGTGARIVQKLEYIPDEEAEVYFKASDVAVLPYTLVFQSGVLLLAYSFGLPVIATDVGSLSEDIVPGRTGLLCRPRDAADLARAIREYFDSGLYEALDCRRQEIKDHAEARYSWDVVGDMTRNVYTSLLTDPHR